MKIAIGHAVLALALTTALAAQAARPVDAGQDAERAGWNQTAPGVYVRTLANGEQWEAHVGAAGSARDRVKLEQQIATARAALAANRDPKATAALQQTVADLEAMYSATMVAPAADGNAAARDTLHLSATGPGTAAEYNYHDQLDTALCGFNVSLGSDMGDDAMPGADVGYAQATASWAPDNTSKRAYRLTISGYAQATNTLGTVTTSLGPVQVPVGTWGTVASPVAQTSGVAFGCQLETYTQIVGQTGCPAPGYVSLWRTKYCYELVH